MLTKRRAELYKQIEAAKPAEEAENVSEIRTGSKQPGPAKTAGSVRDQAKKTGEDRNKVRRAELYAAIEAEKPAEEAAASVTQIVSGKKDVKGERDGGSVRDQSAKTGENREKVRRSKSRADKIGTERLEKIVGTSLAKKKARGPIPFTKA